MFRKLAPLTLLVCLCFVFFASSAIARNGINASITSGPLFVDDINGLDHKVGHTQTYTYTIQMESDVVIIGASSGFLLYSPDGSITNVIWNSVPTNVGPWGDDATWNFSGSTMNLIMPFPFDGSLPSSWLTFGVSFGVTGYGPIGLTDGVKFTITFPGIDGGVLCLDSVFIPLAGEWLWVEPKPAGTVFGFPPEWQAGSGDINVGGTRTSALCVTAVDLNNSPPTITCPPDISFFSGSAATSPPASVIDADAGDTHVYSLVSVSPVPFGSMTVDPATGAVSFVPDDLDRSNIDTDFSVCISVTDGIDTDECCLTMTAIGVEPFCVSIDQTDKTAPLGGSLQGHQVEVCLNYDGGSLPTAGFDFLIEYDNSALSFIGATEGNIFPDYKWEYFTYRFGPNGNCTGGCPSGKLRVIGIADQNDGTSHPTNNQLVVGDDFACLTFLVSNDRNLACQFAPIRWCWLDCGDNVISSSSGDTLFISRKVFDYIGTDTDNIIHGMRAEVTGADQTFPTSTGAPSACDVSTAKAAPIRFIDFKHGGVQVICADLIDDRGDINLNGLSNEIADATMYTNYFVEGLNAFGSHIEGSIAASEVNGDGLPLTVADLVYLIRVIVGDAQPLPKETFASSEIIITTRDGVISSNTEIGAALFVFDGYADINLLATNMNLKVGQVAGNTHALVYNIGSEVINAGDILQSSGALLSVEAANYNGIAFSPILETVKPTSFALHQNYPNPFNPSTTISIDFPKTSEYSLTIYNVRGQKVKKFSGTQSAGTLDIVWEPSELPSGVYFYKLRASDFVATKKLVLLK